MYDNLDFMRGVQVFLTTLSAATLWTAMDLRDGPMVVEVPPGVSFVLTAMAPQITSGRHRSTW